MKSVRPRNSRRLRPVGAIARAALLAGVCLTMPAGPAALAQESEREALESVNRQIEQTRAKSRALEAEAQRLADEVNALRQKLITAARNTQEREALISALEDQLVSLENDLAERRRALALRHGQLSGTLGALARLSKDPPQAVFLYPGTPQEAVRGAVLLRAAVPALEARARLLRDDLEALATVREDIENKVAALGKATDDLAQDRAELKGLLERKRGLYERTAKESSHAKKQLDRLVSESRSLQELVARLRQAEQEAEQASDAVRAKPDPADPAEQVARAPAPVTRPEGLRPFPEDGAVTAPARGDLMQRYGADTGFGHSAKGITIATRPGAQVVAPYDGKVMFAGPFRDLGRVLIIEHDGGYHSVMSGFSRIDAVTGQWVLAGEPVGIMSDQIADSADDAARPRLYVEMRRGGQPVNPLRWITAGSLKVHG